MLQWNGKDLTSEDVYFMSESFSRAARSAREMARMLLRWLVLALPIGLLCGGIGTAFHLAVEAVTELRGAHGWLLWLLPAAGLAIVALYKGTKCEGVGTNNVIRAVQSGEAVSPLLVPAIFFGTVLTHLCGGSAGREGAALQMATILQSCSISRTMTAARPRSAAWPRSSPPCSAPRWRLPSSP